MKTGKERNEVLNHLANLSIGYSDEASQKIVGFLLGIGILQRGERVEVSIGDNEFPFFYDWFYDLYHLKVKGRVVTILNEDEESSLVLCLTNIENGKFLAFDGNEIKVYTYNEECVNVNVSNMDVLNFYKQMHERGFSYDKEFFLTKEI